MAAAVLLRRMSGIWCRRGIGPAVGLAMLLSVTRVAGADSSQRLWPMVHEYTVASSLAEAAKREGIALADLELAPGGAPASPEDTVVLLVVLDERVRQTQWIIALRGPLHQRVAPADPQIRDRVFYSVDGRAIRFVGRREAYEVRALGPLRTADASPPVPMRRAEIWLDASCLEEPFVRAARFMMRAGLARKEGRLGEGEFFTVLANPPRRGDAQARARFVEAAGLTEADERAVAAAVPMLTEFARVMADTPGLREVLFSIVKRPSLGTILARMGRLDAAFRFLSGEVTVSMGAPPGFAGLGACHAVPFEFRLNGEKTLDCTLLAAEARSPLRLCGGIVAMVAASPENPDARLVARVIATRPGARTH